MLSFSQRVADTKFIFVVEPNELKVVKYYNAKGLKYNHTLENDVSVAELARLVEMFKKMPDEMWELVEPKLVENFVPKNNSKGVRRLGH